MLQAPTLSAIALDGKHASSSSSIKTCAEYFAGIGLVRMGLEKAGWEIKYSNDWEAQKREMYSAYFKDAETHYSLKNIFEVCAEEVPESLLATASFPCVDLSVAGNMKGIDGKHSSAFWGFTNIISSQAHKPAIIMLENVVGWLRSNHGEDFRLTLRVLNDLGYACDVFVIDAARFVPQSRPRVFVIGTQISSPCSDILTLARRPKSLTTKALNEAIAANQDLSWNFLDVPAPPEKSLQYLEDVVEILDEDSNLWWPKKEVERHLKMMNQTNYKHVKEAMKNATFSYFSMYRRVRDKQQRAEIRKDRIAGCLRTAKGGSSRQMLVRVNSDSIRMRLMTPREYARLQGVPDSYPIPAQKNQSLTAFGDAVCVPLITWIGNNILNPLVDSALFKD